MLTKYGRREWLVILLIGAMLTGVSIYVQFWWALPIIAIVLILLLQFFRDPNRKIPDEPGLYVAPSDGIVSSVHVVEDFELFDGPAQCVRIFMSVFHVHVNRAPCDGIVKSKHYREGIYMNTLKAISAEKNEQLTTLMVDEDGKPVAAVRQIAGAIARTIVNPQEEGNALKRGERFGMIKFGSTTELYVPIQEGVELEVLVEKSQGVKAGADVLMKTK